MTAQSLQKYRKAFMNWLQILLIVWASCNILVVILALIKYFRKEK